VFVQLSAALFRSRTALAAENLFLRKQLALFQEREETHDSCGSLRFCQARSLFRLAQRLSNRQASYFDRLASSCFPPILVLEVETCRTATNLSRVETLDPTNGYQESDLA
jgi:hypothetical protein